MPCEPGQSSLLVLQIVCHLLHPFLELSPASPACPGPAQKVFPQIVAPVCWSSTELGLEDEEKETLPCRAGGALTPEPHMVTSDSP